jgi:hypothetical protein
MTQKSFLGHPAAALSLQQTASGAATPLVSWGDLWRHSCSKQPLMHYFYDIGFSKLMHSGYVQIQRHWESATSSYDKQLCMKASVVFTLLNFRGKSWGGLKTLTTRVIFKLDKWRTYTTAAAATSNLSCRHNLLITVWILQCDTLPWTHTNVCQFRHHRSFTITHKAKEFMNMFLHPKHKQ